MCDIPAQQDWWFRCLYWCPAVSLQLCSNIMRKMPIKKAQESCSVAGWFKLDTCMKWLKIGFLNLKIIGGQYVWFTSAGVNKNVEEPRKSSLPLQIYWWRCWRQKERNAARFWCLSICKESQLFSYLSSHYLLPNLQISNTFLLFSNFDPSFRGSVARTH